MRCFEEAPYPHRDAGDVVPVGVEAQQRLGSHLADAVEGVGPHCHIDAQDPRSRVHADGVVAAGVDHASHTGLHHRVEQGRRRLDVSVQDRRQVGLGRYSGQVHDGVHAVDGPGRDVRVRAVPDHHPSREGSLRLTQVEPAHLMVGLQTGSQDGSDAPGCAGEKDLHEATRGSTSASS